MNLSHAKHLSTACRRCASILSAKRHLRPAGLLAHPYMLGPNGDSNGCVSFKDYATFLRAYQSGEIKRLAVVAKM